MARRSYQAVLLVDGYNIIGAWPRLQRVRDEHGLEDARRDLVESLTGYSTFKGFDTRVVFDAYGQIDPSIPEAVTEHLSIHYTDFGQTADSYIEKACAQFRYDVRKFSQRLIVATSDRAQQLTVVGYGAEWMSAHRLISDVDLAHHQVRRRQKPARSSNKRFLFSSLDPKAQARLSEMRLGLQDRES